MSFPRTTPKTNAEIEQDLTDRFTLGGNKSWHWEEGERMHGVATYELWKAGDSLDYRDLTVNACPDRDGGKAEANRFYTESTATPMILFTATVTEVAVSRDPVTMFLRSEEDPVDAYTYTATLTDVEIENRKRSDWEQTS